MLCGQRQKFVTRRFGILTLQLPLMCKVKELIEILSCLILFTHFNPLTDKSFVLKTSINFFGVSFVHSFNINILISYTVAIFPLQCVAVLYYLL